MRTANTYPQKFSMLTWLLSWCSQWEVSGWLWGEQSCAVGAWIWNSILHTPLGLRSCLFWVHQLCSVPAQHHQLFTLHLPALGLLADQTLKMSCFSFFLTGFLSLGLPVAWVFLLEWISCICIREWCSFSTFAWFQLQLF